MLCTREQRRSTKCVCVCTSTLGCRCLAACSPWAHKTAASARHWCPDTHVVRSGCPAGRFVALVCRLGSHLLRHGMLSPARPWDHRDGLTPQCQPGGQGSGLDLCTCERPLHGDLVCSPWVGGDNCPLPTHSPNSAGTSPPLCSKKKKPDCF